MSRREIVRAFAQKFHGKKINISYIRVLYTDCVIIGSSEQLLIAEHIAGPNRINMWGKQDFTGPISNPHSRCILVPLSGVDLNAELVYDSLSQEMKSLVKLITGYGKINQNIFTVLNHIKTLMENKKV